MENPLEDFVINNAAAFTKAVNEVCSTEDKVRWLDILAYIAQNKYQTARAYENGDSSRRLFLLSVDASKNIADNIVYNYVYRAIKRYHETDDQETFRGIRALPTFKVKQLDVEKIFRDLENNDLRDIVHEVSEIRKSLLEFQPSINRSNGGLY